jgi:hypothetical protein
MTICPRCGVEKNTYLSVCSACTQTENLLKGQREIFQNARANQEYQFTPSNDGYSRSGVYTPPNKVASFITWVIVLAVITPVVGFMSWFVYTFFSFFLKFAKFFFPLI